MLLITEPPLWPQNYIVLMAMFHVDFSALIVQVLVSHTSFLVAASKAFLVSFQTSG